MIGRQPSYSNVRLPTSQQPEAQRNSVQNAHKKGVQQSACRTQSILERHKPVDRPDTSTRDFDSYTTPSSKLLAKANLQSVRKRHLVNDNSIDISNEQIISRIGSCTGGKKQCIDREVQQRNLSISVVDLTEQQQSIITDKCHEKNGNEKVMNVSGSSSADCVSNDPISHNRESFLSIPLIKHNPPELIQQIQCDEVRE